MDLPDIKAKVKVDTSGVAEADAKLKVFSRSVKDSLGDDNTGVERFGETTGRVFLKFGEDGRVASARISSSTATTRADLDKLEQRARTFADGMETDFKRGSTAVIRLSEDGQAALGNVTRNLGNLSTAATGGASTLAGLGPAGLIAVAAIAELAGVTFLALAPVLAFTVAAAAMVTGLALLIGVVGGLAAGIVVLAAATQGWLAQTKDVPTAEAAVADAVNAHQKAVLALEPIQKQYNATSQHSAAQTLALHQAQQAVTDSALKLTQAQKDLTAAQTGAMNPLEKLKTDLGAMADRLAILAVGPATALLGLLDSLVPVVQELGSSLIVWFGARLTPILAGATFGIGVLVDVLEKRLGPAIGKFIDGLLNDPNTGKNFQAFVNKAADAVEGLLGVIRDLTNWWNAHHTELEKSVQTVMEVIGKATLIATEAFGWMAIQSSHLDDSLMKLATDFKTILGPALQEISKHQEVVNADLTALEILFAIVSGAVLAPLAAFATLIATLLVVEAVLLRAWDATEKLRAALHAGDFGGAIIESLHGISLAADGAVNAIGRLLLAASKLPGLGGLTATGAALIDAAGALPGGNLGSGHFASGGFAIPGSVFQVGERGPEMGYAVPGGGVVITPESGSGRGSAADYSGILASIDRRLAQIAGAPSLGALAAAQRSG